MGKRSSLLKPGSALLVVLLLLLAVLTISLGVWRSTVLFLDMSICRQEGERHQHLAHGALMWAAALLHEHPKRVIEYVQQRGRMKIILPQWPPPKGPYKALLHLSPGDTDSLACHCTLMKGTEKAASLQCQLRYVPQQDTQKAAVYFHQWEPAQEK